MLQVDLYTIFASKNRWTTATSVKTSNNAVFTATHTRYLTRESTFFCSHLHPGEVRAARLLGGPQHEQRGGARAAAPPLVAEHVKRARVRARRARAHGADQPARVSAGLELVQMTHFTRFIAVCIKSI